VCVKLWSIAGYPNWRNAAIGLEKRVLSPSRSAGSFPSLSDAKGGARTLRDFPALVGFLRVRARASPDQCRDCHGSTRRKPFAWPNRPRKRWTSRTADCDTMPRRMALVSQPAACEHAERLHPKDVWRRTFLGSWLEASETGCCVRLMMRRIVDVVGFMCYATKIPSPLLTNPPLPKWRRPTRPRLGCRLTSPSSLRGSCIEC